MLDGNFLLLLKQINICVGLYSAGRLENEDGMTFPQIFLLNEIFTMQSEPQICSRDLSERVGFSRATISATLKQLKRSGYIKMDMDEEDNRKKYIVLTSKGLKAKLAVKEYMDGLLHCLCRTVTERDLLCTEKTLEKFLTNIQQEIERRPLECNTKSLT